MALFRNAYSSRKVGHFSLKTKKALSQQILPHDFQLFISEGICTHNLVAKTLLLRRFSFWHEDIPAVREDTVRPLRCFPYTVYGPDTDVGLPGRLSVWQVRIPCHSFSWHSGRIGRGKGPVLFRRCFLLYSPPQGFRTTSGFFFFQVGVRFHLCVWIFHAFHEFIGFRIRYFSRSTAFTLFDRSV